MRSIPMLALVVMSYLVAASINSKYYLQTDGICERPYQVPPDSYSPYYSVCDAKSYVRLANNSVSDAEKVYVSVRDHYARKDFLSLMDRLQFHNIADFLPEGIVKIGIAISGGGYRAMLGGAGVLSAYDSRTPGSEHYLGGIYQSASYIAGNSGGSWLVANNLLNDGVPIYRAIRSQAFDSPLMEGLNDLPFPNIKERMDQGTEMEDESRDQPIIFRSGKFVAAVLQAFFTKTSDRESQRIASSGAHQVLNFYRDLNIEVRDKKNNGFKISLTDYWGRAVSKKVFPEGKRSINTTLSSVTRLESFRNFSQPFPILGSVERLPGTHEDSINSHVFEFNPFEFGSWDSNVNLFVDLKYLGTKLENGVPASKTEDGKYAICVSGYDNLALVVGASSSLFNTFFHYVYRAIFNTEAASFSILSQVLTIFGLSSEKEFGSILHPEYAVFSPNPFYESRRKVSCSKRGRLVNFQKRLFIVDGGDDGQNIPFQPLLIKSRGIEVIFAYDASADLDNFPNGTSLVRTGQRYHALNSSLVVPVFRHNNQLRSIFPKVPDQATYMKLKLGEKPVFFGCNLMDYPVMDIIEGDASDRSRFDVWEDYSPAIVVYHANHNHSYASNTSTFKTTYSGPEVLGMVTNGYKVASNPKDADYKHCVGCVLLKRRADLLGRTHELPHFCTQCFADYCWGSSHSPAATLFSSNRTPD